MQEALERKGEACAARRGSLVYLRSKFEKKVILLDLFRHGHLWQGRQTVLGMKGRLAGGVPPQRLFEQEARHFGSLALSRGENPRQAEAVFGAKPGQADSRGRAPEKDERP